MIFFVWDQRLAVVSRICRFFDSAANFATVVMIGEDIKSDLNIETEFIEAPNEEVVSLQFVFSQGASENLTW